MKVSKMLSKIFSRRTNVAYSFQKVKKIQFEPLKKHEVFFKRHLFDHCLPEHQFTGKGIVTACCLYPAVALITQRGSICGLILI